MRKTHGHRVVLLAAGLLVLAPAQGQPGPAPTPGAVPPGAQAQTIAPGPLTLAEAIRLALRLQPDLAAAQADREAAQERLRQTRARFLPTVTPQYTYINNYTFVNANRFTTLSSGTTGNGTNTTTPTGGTRQTGGTTQIALPQSSTRETKQGDLSVRYLLYDSGQRQANARQAQANLRAAGFGQAATRQAVIANVADAYFTVLRNDALVRVSDSQVARAQNTLDVVRAQVEAGVAPRKDTFQAEADLANAQVELLQARNNVDVAQAQLKNTLGVVGGGRLTLADVPAPTPTTPTTATVAAGASGSADPTIEAFTNLALQTRPDIAQSAQSIDIDRAGLRLAKINSGVLLTSDTALGYQFSPDSGNNREVTAQISYPLFDAGLARAQVRESEAQIRASEARLSGVQQQVVVEVEQAFRLVTEARARVPAAEAAQRAAQINYDAALESQREGVGNIIEVINAQTLLVQAQTNVVEAVYDFYTQDAQLARAVGQADRIAQVGR